MIIQVDGAGCKNKGAQLMLTAVMQEVKEKFPDAKLIVNSKNAGEVYIKSYYGNNYIVKRKESFYRLVDKLHLIRLCGLFSRRLTRFITTKHAFKGVDLVLNVGGFQFGDQWNHSNNNVADWRDYLEELHRYGTKTVFMPQAFGPFEKNGSKKMLRVLIEYADLLIARDDVSYNYLIAEGVDKSKVLLYPDFTTLVSGVETVYSKQHRGKVCVIPNCKIIQTGIMDKDTYLNSIVKVIRHIYEKGYGVILLNHEGRGDYNLCKDIACQIPQPVDVITGLNAIETKGIIANSYLVISSRFHGVANALSSCVPCLATSWSHKYQKLLEEYAQEDNLLDLLNLESALTKVDNMLDKEYNNFIRKELSDRNSKVKEKNREMWDKIWVKMNV